MKFYKKYFFITLSALFLLSSCQQEDLDNEGIIVDPDPEVEIVVDPNPLLSQGSSSSDGYQLSCFSVDYPFELIDADGVTYQVNNEDELNSVIESSDCVEFVYPLNITFDDGTTDTITEYYDLLEAYASCEPKEGCDGDYAFLINSEDDCHEFVYPFELVDEDQNIITVADEQEFVAAVAEESILSFSYPLTLEHVDGNTRVFENEEDLNLALYGCSEEVGLFMSTLQFEAIIRLDCVDITYPMTVTLLSGVNAEINDDDELMSYDLATIESVKLPIEITILATGTTEEIYESITLLDLTFEHCQ